LAFLAAHSLTATSTKNKHLKLKNQQFLNEFGARTTRDLEAAALGRPVFSIFPMEVIMMGMTEA